MEVDKEKTHKKFTFTDKNIAIILTLVSLATFFYDVILSDVRDCLEMVDDRQRQITIIIISHNIKSLNFCDKIYEIKNKNLIETKN